MKSKRNLYFILIAFLLISFSSIQSAYASHIAGSEITYKCTATPGLFEVTLILYRTCDGGSAPLCGGTCGAACTQTMSIQGADPNCSSSTFGTITLNLVSVRDININNNCPGAKNACTNMGCVAPGTYTPAIERYEFSGIANIGPTSGIPTSCCNVRVSYSLCCRSSAILTGAANANFYIDAIINRCHSVSPCNSSPTLTNDPYMIACGNENYVFNNGATDPDHDSLSYSFAPALDQFGTPVPYIQPFAYNKPMPWTGNASGQFPAGIHCDPQNGDIMYTPPNNSSTSFTGVVAVEIKQWKLINGVMTVIGITRRDVQTIILANCIPNNPPQLHTTPPEDGNVNIPKINWEICAGEQFCFNITAGDIDFNPPVVSDTTYLSWDGALAQYGATFLPDYDSTKRRLPDSLGGGPREDRYRFCWTPTTNMASTNPYYFSVQAKDNRCPNPGKLIRAFAIKVVAKPSITLQRSIDTCGVLHVSFTNNTPLVKIDSYIWDISPSNNPLKHFYYTNQNPVSHPIWDTGMYNIQLALTPGTTGSITCSSVAVDSIRAVHTSLADSLVVTHPTCSYSQNGQINILAINGAQPFQYALNQGAYSTNHLFTSLPVGNYTVRIKDAGGCVIEHEVQLEGLRLINGYILGLPEVSVGDTAIYGCNYSNNTTAVWAVTNGTIILGQNTPYIHIRWDNNGTGTIKLIVSDSNCSDTTTANITIGHVGLAKIQNPMGIKVYPNPTQSILNIEATLVPSDSRIQVYNILGKLVMEKELTAHQQLNLEAFPNGLYFVKIGDWNTSVVKE